MSEFINTIDILGDDGLMDSIITRSITEFKDDEITTIGAAAFSKCNELERVELPNVVTINAEAFSYCSKLKHVEMPSLTTASGTYCFGYSGIEELSLPNLSAHGSKMFIDCTNLRKLDLPKLTKINSDQFIQNTLLKRLIFPSLSGDVYNTSIISNYCLSYVDLNKCTKINPRSLQNNVNLKALVIRSDVVASLSSTDALNYTPISSGTGYIYVPRALVDSYKSATNWSTFANQFRALEDYTIDGTVNGTFYTVNSNLINVISSNTSESCKNTYSATLTPESGYTITDVIIFMDDEDVTNSVYDENGNINIQSVTGDITIIAAASNTNQHFLIRPYGGNYAGKLPCYKFNVNKGQTIDVTYFLFLRSGAFYDGKQCGVGYVGGTNIQTGGKLTKTLTATKDGYILFSTSNEEYVNNGELSNSAVTGFYMYISIT